MRNITDNIKLCVILIIFYIIIGFLSIPLRFIFVLLLLFIPGKKEFDKIVSGKLFITATVTTALIILSNKYLGYTRIIPSYSMADTIINDDRVIVNIFEKNYQRGDIIIHKAQYGDYIKRIIGLPGEKLEIKTLPDGASYVYINGKKLNEPYIKSSFEYPICNNEMNCNVTISDNEFFVLGDNRGNSYDSRFYGPIDKKLIKGKVSHIFFPFERRHVFTKPNYTFSVEN